MSLYLRLILLLFCLLPIKSYAQLDTFISINTGSFLFHLVPFDTESNQYFDNQYFSVERKFSKNSDYSLIAGTFLNSQANRCFLLGVRKDWYQVNNRLVFKGIYSYAGEFFFDAFEDCGEGGVYRTSKENTGLAFVPYIYHAAQYNFNDHIGVEAGFMLPFILVMSVQWSF
jgi:hypothetical protein